MQEFPITLTVPELRPLESTARGIAKALVETMGGTIDSGILSSEEEPLQFAPFCLQVGSVTIDSNATADRRQILQDKSGVIALLDDAYGKRDTVILPEGLVSVDWDKGKRFLVTLSGNRQSAFYMFHQKDGEKRDIILVNNGTNQLVGTWDADILWQGGTAPVMPAASAGGSALQVVTIRDINNILYGEYLNYSASQPLLPL